MDVISLMTHVLDPEGIVKCLCQCACFFLTGLCSSFGVDLILFYYRLPPHGQVSGGGMGSDINENSSLTTPIWLPQRKVCLFCLPVPTTIILSDGIDLVYMLIMGQPLWINAGDILISQPGQSLADMYSCSRCTQWIP